MRRLSGSGPPLEDMLGVKAVVLDQRIGQQFDLRPRI
jgi:hypothetical protein